MVFMSSYHVQMDSLYFHLMKGLTLKDKTNIFIGTLFTKTSMIHKNPLLQYDGTVGFYPHCFFCLYQNEGGNIDKNW